MRKTLVFDADRSLKVISPKEDVLTEIFGVPPVPCASMYELERYLRSMISFKPRLVDHPVLGPISAKGEKGTTIYDVVFKEEVQKLGLWGIAIDTLSHMGNVTFRDMAKTVMGHELNEVKSVDRGLYMQYRDYGGRLLNLIKHTNFPVICNVHAKDVETTIGNVRMPNFISDLKKDLGQYFDVVVYSVFYRKDKDSPLEYGWRIEKTEYYGYAKIRVREAHEMLGFREIIPQDFGLLIDAHEKVGEMAPKILVIADTSQGKTSALATINGYYPPDFNKKELTTNNVEV